MQQITHDVLILGTGLAGLRAAVELCIKTRGSADIAIVSKCRSCARIPCVRKEARPR